LAELPVEGEYASEFRYRRPLLCSDDVVIAVSQSGETADTLEAVKIGKEFKALTVGIVNAVGSSIARLTDAGIYLHAGPEIGVASTKAFTGQVIALMMVALQLAGQRGTLTDSKLDEYFSALNDVPDLIEQWLEPLGAQVKLMAKYFRLASNVFFCGCGIHLPVALEGALKLKEISYIHAEGFPAVEFKHGPFALVRNFLPLVVIAMRSDPAYQQIRANIKTWRAKNASLIVLTDCGNDDFAGIATFVIHCPPTKLEFEPLIAVIPLQLLSYYIADMRGCSIDQPRNLAKSVTVE
jgi:glucosamine--fructose-6-phosphate aminotransferase (isomerizing)